MYWVNVKQILRANLDGSDVEPLIAGLPTLKSIVLDVNEGKMYWGEITPTHRIQRANLDGSGIEEVIALDAYNPTAIALDLNARKVYWIGAGLVIQRANLDGSNVTDLVTSQLENAVMLTLDVSMGKMYWTDIDTETIRRANLEIPPGDTPDNRSDIEDLITGLGIPYGITLDLTCPVPGDGNADSEVDLLDFACLQRCFSGAIGPVTPFTYASSCRCLDADEDGDIDLADYTAFLAAAGS